MQSVMARGLWLVCPHRRASGSWVSRVPEVEGREPASNNCTSTKDAGVQRLACKRRCAGSWVGRVPELLGPETAASAGDGAEGADVRAAAAASAEGAPRAPCEIGHRLIVRRGVGEYDGWACDARTDLGGCETRGMGRRDNAEKASVVTVAPGGARADPKQGGSSGYVCPSCGQGGFPSLQDLVGHCASTPLCGLRPPRRLHGDAVEARQMCAPLAAMATEAERACGEAEFAEAVLVGRARLGGC